MGHQMTATLFKRLIAAALVSAGLAHGSSALASEPQASFATIGAQTSVPYGWVDFCGRRPEVCHVKTIYADSLGQRERVSGSGV
jgi:predicted transglutaminase-like cysteine proteinase